MRSINKVILIGNVTRDPEIRKTPNDQTVATFGLATNREWNTRDGRKQNLAEFHNLVAWANLAEICEKFIKKGKLLYIEGYLKTRSWDSQEGIKKFKTEVVVQDLIMLDKKQQSETSDFIPEETPSDILEEEPADTEPAETTPEKAPAEKVEKAKPVKKVKKAKKEPKEKSPAKEGAKETAAEEPKPTAIDIDEDLGL